MSEHPAHTEPAAYDEPHQGITEELRLAAAHIRTAADFVTVQRRSVATIAVDAHYYLMDIQRAYLSLALAVGAARPKASVRALSQP